MFDIDPDIIGDAIEDTIESFGSTVALPGGVTLLSVKITNEKEMAKLLRIEGQAPDKVTSVFLFDRTARGTITVGSRMVNLDNAYIAEMIHTEVIANEVVYVAAGAYEAT